MFEFLGDVERGVATLYPHRVLITLVTVVAVAGGVALAWRRGWLANLAQVAGRRPLASTALLALVLIVTVPVGWYLASPLWTRTTLVEASPLEVARETASPVIASTPAADTASPSSGGVAEVDSTTPTATESPSGTEASFVPREVQNGEWVGADDLHFAEGRALIIETEPDRYILRVEDFSVRNGPDLFVYLSPSPDGYAEGGLNLGELKATDGAFNYEIPEGTDLSAYRSAVVWFEQFAVLFATATFDPE